VVLTKVPVEVLMKFFGYAVVWVVLFGVPARSVAAQGSSADAAAQADAAYQAQDWARATALYSGLSELPDAPPRVWIRLGNSQRSLGQNDAALATFDKASQAGVPQFGEYGKATVYAATGQAVKAFEALDRALAQGYADPDTLRADPNLNILHDDPRFAKLVELAQKNQRPCVYTPENRQFDFWIGEWTVTTTQGGMPAGDSKIELILQDCVILENWKSGGISYAGNSYNIYNQALKRWEQYWVDNVGGNIFFHGNLKDGVMDYWTDEIPQPDGKKLRRHSQFIPAGPDRVRQFSQGSSDGGKTWQVEYDFTYDRKKT
jgi:tetratricopeptide (TPR) repeat protein